MRFVSTKRFVLLLVIGLSASAPALAASWHGVDGPHPGPAHVVGFYSAGCLAGGKALDMLEHGLQVMRPSRERYYGHPMLVDFLATLGRRVADKGWGRLLVGDMAQPRGGPMRSGHRSHQTGLDVDLWFRLIPPGQALSRRQTEKTGALSLVDAAAGRVNGNWSPRYGELLRMAARDDRVQRIFVNPVIKQHLCRTTRGGRDWLGKLRPWWGHDDHWHVRLYCPPGEAHCTAQDEPPPGDGCHADLDNWVEDQRQAALNPKKPVRPPTPYRPKPLPVACDAVFEGGALPYPTP